MADLEKYSNLYADLAQATYNGRSIQFPYSAKKWNDKQLDKYRNKEAVPFTFPNAKDAHGNDASTVYLQPDNTVKTIKEKNWVGREKVYKKGLSTQKKSIKNNQNRKNHIETLPHTY